MNKINQKGYALLFTVVMVSIISLLAFGLANTTLKQLILSLGAKDSQVAFFQSDMAVECALYIETRDIYKTAGGYSCGVDKNGSAYNLTIGSPSSISGKTTYLINPPNVDSLDPCFRIKIIKENSEQKTTILASGYNICNLTKDRTVERTIEIIY